MQQFSSFRTNTEDKRQGSVDEDSPAERQQRPDEPSRSTTGEQQPLCDRSRIELGTHHDEDRGFRRVREDQRRRKGQTGVVQVRPAAVAGAADGGAEDFQLAGSG